MSEPVAPLTPATIDAVAKAIAEHLTAVCGRRLGAEATSAPSDAPGTTGLVVALPVAGAVSGRVTVWFERSSAVACARVALSTDAPDDAAVETLLMEMTAEAATLTAAMPGFAGVTFGATMVTAGHAAAGARASYVAVPNTASCLFAVGVDRQRAAAQTSEERLGAVLDVDLPLVVRFGRAVLPLRSIAELGPGSVVDMGRSPDEPVDILVGDRLIARGEVVVIGGNYGVRITQLVAGRELASNDKEARMS